MAEQNKIAILGTTPTRMEAPINDPSWKIWTIGPGGKDAHRWDRLFEVHGTWPEDFKGYLNDLSNVKPPQEVWTLCKNGAQTPIQETIAAWGRLHGKTQEQVAKDITGNWSGHRLYPREHVLAKYGRRMWFSSSIAWCIALAIEEGATDIGMFGIDLESGEEYISQFIGCAHFIDLARLIGINVHLPQGCGLMRDPSPYPDRYETHLALTFERKRKFIAHMLSQAEPEYESLRMDVYRKEGELLALRRLGVSQENMAEGEKQLIQANMKLGSLAANINHLKGEQSATDYYYRMYIVGLADPV